MKLKTNATQYTFAPRDYLQFMPVIATHQFSHRKHFCPICGWTGWSVWARADKHWQTHTPHQEKTP